MTPAFLFLGNPATMPAKLCKTVEFMKRRKLALQKQSGLQFIVERKSYDALLNSPVMDYIFS